MANKILSPDPQALGEEIDEGRSPNVAAPAIAKQLLEAGLPIDHVAAPYPPHAYDIRVTA